MEKLNAKVYIVIIIIIIIISSVLAFRTCISDNGSGFKRIIESYNRVKNGVENLTEIIQKSIDYNKRLKLVICNLQAENQRFRNTINELRNANIELDRISTEFSRELARSAGAINNIEIGVDKLESIIDRIRKAGPLEND